MAELASGSQAGTEPLTSETPRNRAEDHDPLSPKEKYEYLTEYGTQILCMLTAEKGCSYLSRNFGVLTGNNGNACLEERFFDLVHADFRDRLRELIAEENGERPIAYRCKMRHGDNKWYWYLFLIHGKQQGGDEIVCILENVHDSIQIQNNLQKAKLEAELALRARSEFLANMSHDLRTPLNAVLGFAQIMDSQMFGKIETPQYLDYIKHIQESGYDLLAKIEDLLEISNIDAGRVVLDREEVMLGSIVKHVMDAQVHHASSAGVSMHFTPYNQDLLLNVDRLKLQHILGHLVANAIRHCSQDGRVEIAAQLSDAGELLLSVSDTGTGMPKAKLGNLIAALEEDNCWTAKNNYGVGLGLALTKEFVSLHGGSVQITSAVGEGTTVQIALPENCVCRSKTSELAYLRQASV